MNTLAERFMDKILPEPNSGCWLWIGAHIRDGYGCMTVNGRSEGAHRVSYRLFCHEIPKGLSVLHKCDVPCCVNPDHLFLGTDADNMRDRSQKGRTARGERNGQARLDARQVADIKELAASGLSQRKVAARFGVSQGHVSRIVRSEQWAHLRA